MSTHNMEMPCRCDCGNWFDLYDGFRSKTSNKVICESCHDEQVEIARIENEIEDLEMQGNKKREIKKLKKELEKLINPCQQKRVL